MIIYIVPKVIICASLYPCYIVPWWLVMIGSGCMMLGVVTILYYFFRFWGAD